MDIKIVSTPVFLVYFSHTNVCILLPGEQKMGQFEGVFSSEQASLMFSSKQASLTFSSEQASLSFSSEQACLSFSSEQTSFSFENNKYLPHRPNNTARFQI